MTNVWMVERVMFAPWGGAAFVAEPSVNAAVVATGASVQAMVTACGAQRDPNRGPVVADGFQFTPWVVDRVPEMATQSRGASVPGVRGVL